MRRSGIPVTASLLQRYFLWVGLGSFADRPSAPSPHIKLALFHVFVFLVVDDEWKRQLKQKIAKTLLSMREEAEAQKEHDLAERPEDRTVIEEEFQSLMRTIEGIATEQYTEELARYREERAWTMGLYMGPGWQEKVVKEQQAILDRIKSESSGAQKEETVPTSAQSKTTPNAEEPEEDSEDKPLPVASKGKKPARSHSLRETPDSPSRPSVNSPPKPPPEIWRPPPESMVEPSTVPQRRGSTASVRSTGSSSYRSTPVTTAATPVADPIPEAQDEVARKSEEEQRRINAAEQQWKAMDAAKERSKPQQQKASSPSTNKEPKLEDKRKDAEDETAVAPSTSPSQSRRPPTPPLSTKPVHRQPSQRSFITETRSHDSPRYYSPSAGPSLLSTSRPPETPPVASSPESYRPPYASPSYHPHMSATLTYASSSPYTHSTVPSPLHHPEQLPTSFVCVNTHSI
uniref:Uncharacterized protein n=1 Tax=Moniliophthora roreri TaxID=221103 RepID=A0A0W0EYT7_MONRR